MYNAHPYWCYLGNTQNCGLVNNTEYHRPNYNEWPVLLPPPWISIQPGCCEVSHYVLDFERNWQVLVPSSVMDSRAQHQLITGCFGRQCSVSVSHDASVCYEGILKGDGMRGSMMWGEEIVVRGYRWLAVQPVRTLGCCSFFSWAWGGATWKGLYCSSWGIQILATRILILKVFKAHRLQHHHPVYVEFFQ